jgi:sulfur transfer complex TusBCD TusB component (DsrH family)
MARIEFRCCVCNQPENQCTCVKYCALCHGEDTLRLTQDGQYYCLECREACQYETQEQV